VEVPAGFMLLAPARLGSVLASPLFTPWGKLRLLLEAAIPGRRDEADESLAAFARRRLGREVWERLVQPLVGGIYTADPERLSLLATLPQFREMERQHGSLIRAARRAAPAARSEATSGARYGLFATLQGGLSTLIERLRARIEEHALIRLGAAVTAIRSGGAGGPWQLDFSDASTDTFDAVIVALPAHRAAAVLQPVDAPLADGLGRIAYASSAVVVTGHKLADVRHPLDAFGLVVPQIENRKVLAVSFASRKFPGRAPDGRVQLRTFVGGALQPELLERSDAELISLVQAELGELLGVRGREDFVHVARYDRAMPQYHVGHVELVRAIEERAALLQGLELAGNAYHGVGLPDCIHSGERAAERLCEAWSCGPNAQRAADSAGSS
jgi:oxygen-dependent protoporphyrinogen oxidase